MQCSIEIPLACVNLHIQYFCFSVAGCEFGSLQHKGAQDKLLLKGSPIAEQALEATEDADATLNKLEGGIDPFAATPATTVVIDPNFLISGVQLMGKGCVANGTVLSGSGCAIIKAGWKCSPLKCEATKWGQARCEPDGDPALILTL